MRVRLAGKEAKGPYAKVRKYALILSYTLTNISVLR
jgi:hypothetical protein